MFLLGSMTLAKLATCPSMAMTTMGAGGAAMGALLPLGGAALGAALGGIAGGTTGGVVSCQAAQNREGGGTSQPYYIKYEPQIHPDG